MKTYCKHTRVANPRFVRESIEHYLKGKRSRRDVAAWLDHHPDLDRIAEAIASEIRTGRFHDTTIRYFNRVEPISGKHRVIGRESVHHQILDHVAIDAMRPMLDAKIGRWQTASVEGRGTIDARKAIKRWTRQRSSRWFVKLDVRKCYPSIDRAILKRLLAKDIGDKTLLRLAYHLIDQYAGTQGLNIGSYASQWLANYYLSYAYHFATERLAKLRRRRDGTVVRHRLVTHVLFYMDDILLIGRGKADLRTADGAHPRLAGPTARQLLRLLQMERQHPIPPSQRHRQDHAPREEGPRGVKGDTMIQTVTYSAEPAEVDYHPRADGGADIRIRRDIAKIETPAIDGQPAGEQWTAREAYIVRYNLLEQEAVEQADQLFAEAEEDSKTDRQRIDELKQLQLNGLDAIASLYEAMGGEQ